MKPTPGDSVAVIGGGAAGLTAALRLAQRGYRVALFEADAEVGGKCSSIEVDGMFIDLGAVLCPPLRYPATQGLLKETGIRALPLSLPLPEVKVDASSGQLVPRQSQFPAVAEILRYSRELIRFRSSNQNGSSFALPFGQWCLDRNVVGLGDHFRSTFHKLGYGDLAMVPAWYALKFFDARLALASLLPGQRSARVEGGFVSLWRAVFTMAGNLGVDFHLSTSVNRVFRDQAGARLDTTRGKFAVDHLVLAINPSQIDTAVTDLDEQERQLIDGTRTAPITTVLAEVVGAGVEKWIGAQVIPNDPAVTMIGLWPWPRKGHAGTVWYISPQDAGLEPGHDPQEGWESWISARNLLPVECHPTRVFEVRHWTEYFPHFTPEAMAAGALKQLSQLQGSRRTYFLGGWTTFELVEDTINQAETLVRRHFPMA